MTKAIAYGYGKEISEILGIQNITDAKIYFPLDGMITADVSFYLTTEQADKLLKSSQSVEQMKAELRKVLDNV